MTHAQVSSERTPNELNQLGMWLFLASEVMLFGSLFMIYLVYRQAYPEIFAEASSHLNALLAGANTALLLTSSLLVALALHWTGENRRIAFWALIGAALLGVAFLGIKGYEYWLEYQENLVPIPDFGFLWEGNNPSYAALFFTLYFIMTGLHAVHLAIGVVYVGIMALRLRRAHDVQSETKNVDIMALYWHFVDLVWVFVFPLLYLIDRS